MKITYAELKNTIKETPEYFEEKSVYDFPFIPVSYYEEEGNTNIENIVYMYCIYDDGLIYKVVSDRKGIIIAKGEPPFKGGTPIDNSPFKGYTITKEVNTDDNRNNGTCNCSNGICDEQNRKESKRA